MQKAIGFIACVSVMAASLFYFSGGDPSQMLSAQTESSDAEAFGPVARKLMDKARQLAQRGRTAEARREAETAAAMFSDWDEGEQTPEQFLAGLGELSGEDASLFTTPTGPDMLTIRLQAKGLKKTHSLRQRGSQQFRQTPVRLK